MVNLFAVLNLTVGYVQAAMIPKGATSIQVSEVKPCSSFLGTNEPLVLKGS